MNASRQVPPGERSGSDDLPEERADPIALIEQALVAMRRDQERRRLQRRAERGEGGPGGWPGEDGPGGRRGGGGRGRRGRGDGAGEGHGDAHDGSHGERGAHDGSHGERGGRDGWHGGRGIHGGHGGSGGSGGTWGPGGHGDSRGDGPEHPHHPGSHRGAHLAHLARFRLLEALEGAERPPSVSELADAIGVDQPRASRLVQAAVEAGHARREIDPADARRSAIVLTDAGRGLLSSARGNRRGAIESALAGFTPDETEQLARLLSRFVEAWPRD